MGDGRFGLALMAGMVATVNPCGLPMLPAYLSYFISGDDENRSMLGAVGRSIAVAGVVSAGFMTMFGVTGAVVSWFTRGVYEITPWISVAVGVVLVGVGAALLAGREIRVGLPRLDRGGRDRGLGSMFIFGLSYAIASVSCTLPVFLAQVSSTLGESIGRGTLVFLTYGLGMTLVLTALSVSLAMARTELLAVLRRSLRVVNRVAGGLMVVAGAYVAYYGLYEIRAGAEADPAIDRVTGWSSELATAVQDLGPAPRPWSCCWSSVRPCSPPTSARSRARPGRDRRILRRRLRRRR
ncbi:MAG: cytochrome c biogenesis CcdA family protein [Acidimicrobiales bacterium]